MEKILWLESKPCWIHLAAGLILSLGLKPDLFHKAHEGLGATQILVLRPRQVPRGEASPAVQKLQNSLPQPYPSHQFHLENANPEIHLGLAFTLVP